MSLPNAIILAGGLGTRLRPVVDHVPKPLAMVGGRPFLAWILERLASSGVRRVVLATGHLGGMIREVFGFGFAGLTLDYSHEDCPLGTGGAVWRALPLVEGERVFVLNGDSYVGLDFAAMARADLAADVIMAVRAVPDRSRYGAVRMSGARVVGVDEKSQAGPGLVNSGVYLLRRDLAERLPQAGAFSLETVVLKDAASVLRIVAFRTDAPFIDIGIPEDYHYAQTLLPELTDRRV